MNSFFEGVALSLLLDIKKLLSKADTNAVNEYGSTALYSALLTNDFSEAKRLILDGANPILQNINGETPLNLFAHRLSVDETYSTFDPQIKLASEADKLSMFDFLIQKGYKDYIFKYDPDGYDGDDNLLFGSVLHQALAQDKFYDTLIFMINHDYHTINWDNQTAAEVESDYIREIVEIYVEREKKNQDTSLFFKIIKLFLEAGFDPKGSIFKTTAYSIALNNSLENILDLMVQPYKNDDNWIQRLWDWADKNKLDDKIMPRKKKELTWMRELTIGSQLTEIPKEIGQLSNLGTFTLYNNQLTEIPKEMGQLSNLERLLISDTQLTKIPKEMGQLNSLTILNLSNNQLTEIPKEIGQLSNLVSLGLSNNQLTEIPKEIGQLSNLERLSLDLNQLTEIPKEVGQLSKLKLLSLPGNNYTEFPKEIVQLTKLHELYFESGTTMTLKQKEWIEELKKNDCKVQEYTVNRT